MSTVKNISGDYIINTPQMTVNGNLIVTGNSSVVTSNSLAVSDNIIMVNDGETGAGVTLRFSGLKVDRGLSSNVSILWDESDDAWKLYRGDQNLPENNDWDYILRNHNSPYGLSEISEDLTPELGANLEIHEFTIYSTEDNIAISTDSVNTGDTGVYVETSVRPARELITKKKAMIYSLIL